MNLRVSARIGIIVLILLAVVAIVAFSTFTSFPHDLKITIINEKTGSPIPHASVTFHLETPICFKGKTQSGTFMKSVNQLGLAQIANANFPNLCPDYFYYATSTSQDGTVSLSKLEIEKQLATKKYDDQLYLILSIEVKAADLKVTEGFYSREELYGGNGDQFHYNVFRFFSGYYTTLSPNQNLALKPFSISAEEARKVAEENSQVIKWKNSYPSSTVYVSPGGKDGVWGISYTDNACRHYSRVNNGRTLFLRDCDGIYVTVDARTGEIKEVRSWGFTNQLDPDKRSY